MITKSELQISPSREISPAETQRYRKIQMYEVGPYHTQLLGDIGPLLEGGTNWPNTTGGVTSHYLVTVGTW